MPPSNRHQWGDGVMPALGDHSAAKHVLLSKYLQKYLGIVCQNPRMDKFDITLVDGFAGGGMYQDDKPGSPLVMIESVEKARIDINNGRGKSININSDYFFVEKDPNNFASLNKVLSENPASPKLLEGDFHECLPVIMEAIKKKNPREGGGAIFFLDQEGFSGVDMATINYIGNELPQSEIIMTFAISHLIDFISDPDALRKHINKMELQHLDVNEIVRIKETDADYRNVIESKFSKAIRKSTSFRHFRPFFVEPEKNHRGYWLLHLSHHYRAHNAMTEATWEVGNHMRHYGGIGTRILDLYYKGGREDRPNLFGKTFSGDAKHEQIQGLMRDLPSEINRTKHYTVREVIEKTCNRTAATPDMYLEALHGLDDMKEITVCGKSGGKKRGGEIQFDDRISVQRQLWLFLPEKLP